MEKNIPRQLQIFCKRGTKDINKIHRPFMITVFFEQLYLSGVWLGVHLNTETKKTSISKRWNKVFKIC